LGWFFIAPKIVGSILEANVDLPRIIGSSFKN
jgi:hypothetical protein